MKKVVFLVLVVVLGFVGWYWWQNLRGAGPAIGEPVGDIVEMFEKRVGFGDITDFVGIGSEELEPGKNSTDFPLKLADGFEIGLFAQGLGKPRVLAFDPDGVLVVSVPERGAVFALPDKDGDGRADETVELIGGLDRPHGLAFKCDGSCRLFVAESSGVRVYQYDEKTIRVSGGEKIVDLPTGGRHFSRTIIISPEDKLLISVGSSCDTCEEGDWRRATILEANLDGSGLREFASGLRNSVFMDYRPRTQELWATEMGRDHLGDDLPPDEVNVVEGGRDYGWPYCYGKQVHDRVFDKLGRMSCVSTEPSRIDLQAHSAPLGLEFVDSSRWPSEMRGDLLVAYHGSWNRSVPTGYKLVRFDLDEEGNEVSREDFVAGWLVDEGALGRPVDLLMGEEGDLFVSDDKAGVIYRVFVIE